MDDFLLVCQTHQLWLYFVHQIYTMKNVKIPLSSLKWVFFLFSSSSLLLFSKVLKGDIEEDGCLSVVYKLICLHYRLYSNGPIMY